MSVRSTAAAFSLLCLEACVPTAPVATIETDASATNGGAQGGDCFVDGGGRGGASSEQSGGPTGSDRQGGRDGSNEGGTSGIDPGGTGDAGMPVTGGVGGAGGAGTTDTPPIPTTEPLGNVAYKQTFDALSPGLWSKNIDFSKIKAHPENAQVTAGCGPDSSNCFRVVYRHPDGIHKQPFSNPIFSTESGDLRWTFSDAGHTNTSTDVTQNNIHIDGSTTGTSRATATAIPAKDYTLFYDLYFEPGFDFAKGGKLPGLAADGFDSGCTEDGDPKRQTRNWSERLMWRANGRVELYSYDQSRASGSCGVDRIIDLLPNEPKYELPGEIPAGSDKFRFKPGIWYTVRLSVRMNDNDSVKYVSDAAGKPIRDAEGYLQPISGNGEVSLAIKTADGSDKRLMVFTNVPLRDECNGPCSGTVPDTKASWVNAVFFSTFFGGNETKRTTCVDSDQSTLAMVVPRAPPTFSGLTPAIYTELCASQLVPAVFPKLTWDPLRPSAARFDNFIVNQGYTNLPF
jgi:hypothetical protein